MRPYYRPPRLYVQTQERRRRDALAAAERQSRTNQRRVQTAIEENGERMSDEGRELLTDLATAFKTVAGLVRDC